MRRRKPPPRHKFCKPKENGEHPTKRVRMDWNKYIQENVSEGDCQVVTAVNAYYFLTGKIIKPNSRRYGKLVELAGAIAGSATCIQKVWKRLGLIVTAQYFSPTHQKLPLEIGVWHKSCGNHSALIVDYEPITESYRIANFRWATNNQGWIYAEDLEHYLRLNVDRKEPRWRFRLYEIPNRGTCI